MHNRLFAPPLLTAVALSFACSITLPVRIVPPSASRSFEERRAIGNSRAIQIVWIKGDLDVLADDSATDITVLGTKTVVAGTADEASLFLAGLDIDIDTSPDHPDTLVIEMKIPNVSITADFIADVSITIPAGLLLSITHQDGNVTVTNQNELTDVTMDDGNVDIVNQRGGHVDVHIDDGHVSVGSQHGNVVVSLDHGAAVVNAAPAVNGLIDVDVISGTANVTVPVDFGAELRLSSGTSDFDLDLDGFDISDFTFSGRTLTAVIGDGNGLIDVQVVSGTVLFSPPGTGGT